VIRPEWRPITQTSTKPPLLFILQFIHSFSLTHTNNPSIESSILLLPLLSHLLPYSHYVPTTPTVIHSIFLFLLFIFIYILSICIKPLFYFKFKFIKIHFGGFCFSLPTNFTVRLLPNFINQFVVKFLSLGLIMEIQISFTFFATYMHIVIDLCFDLCGTFQFFILFKLEKKN
jgi:hypothetical protein